MKSIISINPTTGKELGSVAAMGKKEIDGKIKTARQVFPEWRDTPIKERKKYIVCLGKVIVDHVEEIAALIAIEQGKPVIEAKIAEIIAVLSILKNLARKASKILRDESINHELILFAHKGSKYTYVPYGVVTVISPWNYPFSVPVPQIAAALIAGNTVVFKPAPEAVLIGKKIEELFREAGFPEGVMNTVYVENHNASSVVTHQDVDKVVFTGSTETGRKVMRTAAEGLKPVLLELGGKDPVIIAADANIKRAARATVWGALFTTGQVCASAERVYVEQPVFTEFVETCIAEIKKLRVGDPLQNDVDIGPLSNVQQLKIVKSQVDEAVRQGAKIGIGGKQVGEKGYFFEPTVLTNVNHAMKIMKEETFGPVLPIMSVKGLDEAIELANDSQFGLSAFGWTSNTHTAKRFQRELVAGTVMINDATCTWGEPIAPWGGMKHSGFGRTRSRFGLMEMVQVKFTSYDKGNNAYNPWWFPYTASTRDFGNQAIHLLFGKRIKDRAISLFRLLKNERFVKTAHWFAIIKNLKRIF